MVGTMNEIRALGFKRIWKIVVGDYKVSPFSKAIHELGSLFSVSSIPPYSMLNYWDSISKLSGVAVGGLVHLMQDAAPMIAEGIKPDRASKSKFRHTWTTLWSKFGEACNLGERDMMIISEVGIKLPLYISAVVLGDTSALGVLKLSGFRLEPVLQESEVEQLKGVEGLVAESTGSMPDKLVSDFFEGRLVVKLHFSGTSQAVTLSGADLSRLCLFFNMVFGWYLSVQTESTSDELLSYLAITDFQEFANDFHSGNRLWIADKDLQVPKINISLFSLLGR